jgi:hypothetical protein
VQFNPRGWKQLLNPQALTELALQHSYPQASRNCLRTAGILPTIFGVPFVALGFSLHLAFEVALCGATRLKREKVA